jgi:hypothetical protein
MPDLATLFVILTASAIPLSGILAFLPLSPQRGRQPGARRSRPATVARLSIVKD